MNPFSHGLLTRKEAIAFTGMTASKFDGAVAAGRLSQPFRVSARMPRWSKAELAEDVRIPLPAPKPAGVTEAEAYAEGGTYWRASDIEDWLNQKRISRYAS